MYTLLLANLLFLAQKPVKKVVVVFKPSLVASTILDKDWQRYQQILSKYPSMKHHLRDCPCLAEESPSEIVSKVYKGIKKAFTSLHRFEVIGFKREIGDPEDFVRQIEKERSKLISKKASFSYGGQVISANKARKIANSMYAVFPLIEEYYVVPSHIALIFPSWDVVVQLTLKVYNFKTSSWLETTTMIIEGKAFSLKSAYNNLISSTKRKVKHALLFYPEFTIKTRIKKVVNVDTVIVDGGKNFDFNSESEFEVWNKYGETVGYVKLSKVDKTVSKGKVLWGKVAPTYTLVEKPFEGLKISFLYRGLVAFPIVNDLHIETEGTSSKLVTTELKSIANIPSIGIAFLNEMGYRIRGIVSAFLIPETYLPASENIFGKRSIMKLSGLLANIAIGYEFILGRVSFTPYLSIGEAWLWYDVDTDDFKGELYAKGKSYELFINGTYRFSIHWMLNIDIGFAILNLESRTSYWELAKTSKARNPKFRYANIGISYKW